MWMRRHKRAIKVQNCRQIIRSQALASYFIIYDIYINGLATSPLLYLGITAAVVKEILILAFTNLSKRSGFIMVSKRLSKARNMINAEK